MVSVVIAAYNEAATVAECVRSVIGHPQVNEVVVVDDGSSDATSARAQDAGATVVRLSGNRGKAAALDAGVAAAQGSILLFLDADVTGLTPAAVSRILHPVLAGEVDLHVGIRARKTLWLNRLLHVFPIIGGERALTRQLWQMVPERHKRGFRIEIALNHTAKRRGNGMDFALIEGLTHRTKERKLGLWRGVRLRMRMIGQLVAVTWSLYVVEGLRERIGSGRRGAVRDRG
ncbi:MAG: glycosyltransferase family 2 protein [Pseudomonadota bacterium]|nr:MAG: glycosyltransferase family 2 protein [Pseudomonadota bacterium]